MKRAVRGQALRLDGLLSNAAAIEPGRTAVICGDLSLTYAQVNENARRFAGLLVESGVNNGDRVAFWASNCAEFVEVIFGIPLVGAIAVPLDHWAKPDDALSTLSEVRPKVLVVGAAQAEQLSDRAAELAGAGVERVFALGRTSVGFLPYAASVEAAAPLLEPALVSEDDPALILFTSGSTGRPKGAVHTHRGLSATAQIINLEYGLRDGECTLHFLPIYSSCLEHLIPLTLTRATHVIMPHFDAVGAWDAVAKHGVTHINAVPTTLRRLLDHAPDTIPETLRIISYASEPMPAALVAALMERMPHIELVQLYGMIEQLCLAVQGPAQHRSKPGTIGRPMIGAELCILGSDGRPSDGSEPGEIVARSPTLFSGYWRDPKATAQVLRDGWMHTGDIGQFDADGFLTLSGRLKHVIKSGGVSVIPNEVEEVLLSHERVNEAVVVGIPDENWGEAVHAFVILKQDAEVTAVELIAFCRSRLAGYKTPKSIHFVRELPRTGIGKIARRKVRDEFLRNLQSEAAK